MAYPDANDTVIDPDLDARFSHLNMSTAPADGAATATSSSWFTQDQSFTSQTAAATGFQTANPPLVTDPLLAAQTDPQQQHSFDYSQYADHTTNQAYWAGDGTAQAGPSSDPAAAELLFHCTYGGCPNAYTRQCDLDKHYNNHTKPRKCDFCGAGGAEMKDLNRHMWTHHPNDARRLGIPEERDYCPRCNYSGRKDNVKRHKDKKGHW